MKDTAGTVLALPGRRYSAGVTHGNRGSWIPSARMIGARWRELRMRRGLMFLLTGVTVGIPVVFLAVRLILHAVAPHTYGVAGGYSVYVGLVTHVLYVFGFIVAATLGATAGCADLSEGMFRQHVITGRSRMALYLARIPAGLGIIVPLVAGGFAVVCAVCVLAAPTALNYEGAKLPAQLSETELMQWAVAHPKAVVDNFPFRIDPSAVPNTACLPGPPGPRPEFVKAPIDQSSGPCTPAQLKSLARYIAIRDFSDYSRQFLSPSVSLMVKSGLWIELESLVGLLIGMGVSSLIGQRTVSVVLMIVLEIILTPIALRSHLPHMINLQRAVIGAATAHVEPGRMPMPFGGGSPADQALSIHESTTTAIFVIVAWIVVWTALGAWRMATRDA